MATNKTFHFDTFSGNDISVSLLFPYKDRALNKTYTISVANIMSISGAIQTEGTPRWVMGNANPQAFSQGKRSISGAFVIESLNRSFVQELQELLPDNYFNIVEGISVEDVENNRKIRDGHQINFADQLPEFDILITAVKQDDPSIKAQRRIIGCKVFSETSGIGLSTLDTQEAYQFLAREITPFAKLESKTV